MKITESIANHRFTPKQALQHPRFFSTPLRHLLGMAVAMLFCAASAPAAQYIWDPSELGTGTAGSGTWDTTTADWYPGSGSDVVWVGTGTANGSPANGATFNGPDGTYAITMGVVPAVNNLTINASGYTFSAANAIYLGSSDTLSVAAGKTVTFNCSMDGSGTSPFWVLGSGATMNVGGNLTAGQQVRLAGASGSAYNLTGTGNVPGIVYVLAPVNLTGSGVSMTVNSSFFIGYAQTINSTLYSSGTLTVNGATLTVTGNNFLMGRSSGSGTLTINNNGIVNAETSAAHIFAINYDGSANSSATVNVNGGSLTVGSPTLEAVASAITFFNATGENTTASASMYLTSGTIDAYGGIEFGVVASGSTPGTATLTQSGGILNVGPLGIFFGLGSPNTTITLSGGTVGALGATGWASSLPMVLGTTGGNITFQCNPGANISLSGALTDGGAGGGLNVTGGGTLTLSGANNYIGTTLVSSGSTLAVATAHSPISGGLVTVDGTSASSTLTVNSTPGDSWSMGSGLTFQNGATTLNFQFSGLPPSASVAPIQVTGSVAFSATPPTVNVSGTEIAKGTYPLITYTGSYSGTLPTPMFTGSATAGTIVNTGNTISLQVTGSSITAPVYWDATSGTWNTSTPNWKQQNVPGADYTDGDAVIFDDSAPGAGPFTITLNTTVSPASVTFNNSAKSYAIMGTGNISTGTLGVSGNGAATVATYNTFNGGTTINSGQLNINNGGDANGSAIGTGTLTINGGTIDNTSGSDIILQPTIPEIWGGNFTYAGSVHNFNTGTGTVTMNQNTTVGVNAGNFTVGGAISGSGLGLIKTGNGTLTLATGNSFGGGLTLTGGQVNLGAAGAAGSGTMTINVGTTIDNSSGGLFTLSVPSYNVNGNFTFVGTAPLNLGNGTITTPSGGTLTVDVVANTLENDGNITSGNTRVIKSGLGTWVMGGTTGTPNNFQLEVSAGTVQMAKIIGQTIGPGSIGLTVDAGALVIDEDSDQIHSGTPNSTPVPVNLAGGTFDINGYDENIDELSISSAGTLQDSGGGGGPSTLNLISGHTASLSGTNCLFNIVNGQILEFMGPIGGTGALVTVGPGTLWLMSNNIYTGGTVVSNGTLDVTAPTGSIAGNVSVLANGSTVGMLELDNATSMASTATLSVASGAMANLTYSGTQTIGDLFVGGVQQPPGVYGFSANNPGSVFTGSGTLTVSGGPPITISQPTISGNQLTICWNSVAGANYNVYTTTSLNPTANWTLVNSSPITATGSTTCYTLPGTVSSQHQLFVTVMQ